MTDSPKLSIIVPVRHAVRTIGSTIAALLDQSRGLSVEVIAVVSRHDPSRAVLLKFDNPALRLVIVAAPQGIPQLRREGLWRARAPWVVITEDHCLFADGWVRSLVEGTATDEWKVRGGPVTNGAASLAGWVIYFSRYNAFLPPVNEGPVRTLPGTGACYPRELLLRHAALLRDGFWESELNEALLRENVTFWMSPGLAVQQRQARGLLEFTRLRFRHGRLYGARRIGTPGTLRSLALFLRTPLVPFVLLARSARAVGSRPQYGGRFLMALPWLFLTFCSWAGGESLGYLLGAGSMETD